MKTIVVDASILISALISPDGGSREIIRRCLQRKYTPLISNTLFLEYEDVSSRENIRSLCPLSGNEIRKFLNAFYAACNWVNIYYLWRPNLLDEDDNFLIELALAGGATTIISNNIGDLKNAELKFPNLKISKPEKFLKGDRNDNLDH